MKLAVQTDADALWKRRFRQPIATGMRLAPGAPTRGVAFSNLNGPLQPYAWDVAAAQLLPIAGLPPGVWQVTLAPDGRYFYFLADQQGNEIGHFARIPFQGGTVQDLTPHLPPYSALNLPAVNASGTRMAFLGVLDDGYHLYVLDLAPDGGESEPRQVFFTTEHTNGPVISAAGDIAVIYSAPANTLQYGLRAIDTITGGEIGTLSDAPEGSMQPVAFAPLHGDARLLATTTRSGSLRPLLWNPRTGARQDLALDALEGDVEPVGWSPTGRHVLLCQIARARQQLYTYDIATGALGWLQHPDGIYFYKEWMFPCYASDDEIFAPWLDTTHAAWMIALDSQTGTQRRTVFRLGEPLPAQPLRSVSFASSDGQSIQAWLGLPRGAGPFPTIIEIHGGPSDVVVEDYNPFMQAWLDHGFAVLAVNYRGSISFGRAFADQILGDIGHWELEDIVAAHAWLVRSGVAVPDAIFAAGSSYGGFLTLLALGKRPDLWAGGMAQVAIADWTLRFADEAPTFRGKDIGLFGGSPEEVTERYRQSSPLTYAEHVAAPILVIQGRNDTRCPPRQMEVYEARLKALGTAIEVYWFDAGHSSGDIEELIAIQERLLHFATDALARR